MSWACGPQPKSLYSSAFPSLTSSCLRSRPTIQNLLEIVDVCSQWPYSSASRSGALKNRTSIKWAKQSLGECQDFPYWVHLPLIPVKSFLLGWNGACFEFPVSFEFFFLLSRPLARGSIRPRGIWQRAEESALRRAVQLSLLWMQSATAGLT